jgi:arylsulfatase A-like enzyme
MKIISGWMLSVVVGSTLLTSCASTLPDDGNPLEATPPNIIYIMSDDHTSQAFGVYGSRLASLNPTPHIDRLAREGMLLENAFANNSICTPSRASIMTGQYPQTNGVLDLDGNLPPEKQYLAIEMKKAGYQTAMIGKWHLKQTPNFDHYQVLPKQGKYHNPEFYEKDIGGWGDKRTQHQGHSSDIITDMSLTWLKEKRDKSKPFFLMHHFKAPHGPFEFAKRYEQYLENVNIPEPESLWHQPNFGSVATRGENDSLIRKIGTSISPRHKGRNMGRHMKIDPSLPYEEYTRQSYQKYLKYYLRCVKGVDDNVKRLLDYLEQEGLMENTVIVYTGDQGFMLGEHDYIDKRWMYDESIRMPLLVRYPKSIKAGSRSNALINNIDFAPTLLEFAGVETPAYMQGRSFKSILETAEEPNDWRQSIYYRYWMHMAHHSNPAHFGIRTKEYKLIFYYGRHYLDNQFDKKQTPVGWEFYDLKNDPFEVNNRYVDPKYKNIIAQMKEDIKAMRKKLNETDADYPKIQAVLNEHWND